MSLKDKLLDLKYSDSQSNFNVIITIVHNHEASNIIHSHGSQGTDKGSSRSRKRERYPREGKPTSSPSKPRDKEESHSIREDDKYNKPDDKDTQLSVITYPPQAKTQQPEIEINNSNNKKKYIPPNNAKAVNNSSSTSSCCLY